MGLVWEGGLRDFIIVTVLLGGGAAYLTGRAAASTWRPLTTLAVFVVLLACAVRFVHFALFNASLFALQYFLVDLVVLLIFAGLGYRLTRVSQMVGHYSWLYERTSALTWRPRSGPASAL